ncbi:MAG: cytidylate kinase-like family protein [Actinomycetota bacterium]|nr:cytidylate kinase-like family protein [Actinomycetota bacterium]
MGAVRPVVTISAAYGAGGGVVGPCVAERLGVAFLDRAIPASVAADLAEAPEEVLALEDDLGRGISHWLSFFAPAGAAWAGIPAPGSGWCYDEASYKEHVAAVLQRAADRGAVILGRGAAIVLAQHPGALHVRLDGPPERRIAQVMDLGGVDERSARQAQYQSDTARQRYIHRLYHVDVADHRHYHLWVDATAVPLATCVDIIVGSVEGREALRRLGAQGLDGN